MYDQLGDIQSENPFALKVWGGGVITIKPQRWVAEEADYATDASSDADLSYGGTEQVKGAEDYTWIYVGAGVAAIVGGALLYRSMKKGRGR